jgi:hypothetical protein
MLRTAKRLKRQQQLRPFDAEAFKSKLIDYATFETDEHDAEGCEE